MLLTEKIVATQWVHRQPQVVVCGKPYAHIAQYAREQRRSQSARTWKQGSTLGGVLPPSLRGPVLDLLPPIALPNGSGLAKGLPAGSGAQGAHGTHRHGPAGVAGQGPQWIRKPPLFSDGSMRHRRGSRCSTPEKADVLAYCHANDEHCPKITATRGSWTSASRTRLLCGRPRVFLSRGRPKRHPRTSTTCAWSPDRRVVAHKF